MIVLPLEFEIALPRKKLAPALRLAPEHVARTGKSAVTISGPISGPTRTNTRRGPRTRPGTSDPIAARRCAGHTLRSTTRTGRQERKKGQGARRRSHPRFHPRAVGPDLHATSRLVGRRRD